MVGICLEQKLVYKGDCLLWFNKVALLPAVENRGNLFTYLIIGLRSIFVASVVTATEIQQTLIKGQPGAIYVDIRGYPPPYFTWRKNTAELNITGRYSVAPNGTLLITKVEIGDDGTYDTRANMNFAHVSSGDVIVTLLGE